LATAIFSSAHTSTFSGGGRNTLSGDSFNSIDLTVGKNVNVDERINKILEVCAFNGPRDVDHFVVELWTPIKDCSVPIALH
jgi:hypothetical protein